jgi:glutathionylspermidine synthase
MVLPLAEVRAAKAGDPLKDASLTRELAHRFYIFDPFVAGKRRVDVHPLVLSDELHRAAVRAAEDVARTVGRIAARAHDDETERELYGFKDDTLALARASHRGRDDSSLMRVDLLLDEQSRWQACEINADCPGGHNEAYGLPRLARAAGFSAGENPTIGADAVVDRLLTLARGKAVGLLYATAYAEDLQICALLKRMLQQRGAETILAAPTAPRMRNGQLVIGRTPVGALYRFFPTEWMEGQANVGDIVRAVETGAVRTLSSFQHIFTQSKLGFARAWAHADGLPAEDRAVLARHVPQSIDLADVPLDELVTNRTAWVVKRAMGRVGDQVFVGPLFDQDEWAQLVVNVLAARAAGERWLAQRFVPQRAVASPWGPRYITLGAYVLDGVFIGYFARVTPETHASHDALCVPVFTMPPPPVTTSAAEAT